MFSNARVLAHSAVGRPSMEEVKVLTPPPRLLRLRLWKRRLAQTLDSNFRLYRLCLLDLGVDLTWTWTSLVTVFLSASQFNHKQLPFQPNSVQPVTSDSVYDFFRGRNVWQGYCQHRHAPFSTFSRPRSTLPVIDIGTVKLSARFLSH